MTDQADDKPRLLLIERMMPETEAQLVAAYRVHRLYDPQEREAALALRPEIRAVVTGGGTGLARDWIEAMPRLGIIAINGVGMDKVDLAFARSRGIDVTTTRGTLTDAVAEMAFGLILGVKRRIVEGDAFVRAGDWAARRPFPLGGSLAGRRLGVLGLGQIGRAIAALGTAFGMNVRYWNRSPVTDVAWAAFPDPVALAAECDVLVAAVAATPETEGMVDAAVLAALGPAGVFINIARGSVVDEAALIAALAKGTIAGAGLDVFVNEPEIRADFLDLPTLVLAPHQGSATVETRTAMGAVVVENLAAHFAGQKPPALVN